MTLTKSALTKRPQEMLPKSLVQRSYGSFLANTKHTICTMLVQRGRRWADIVQLFYKCFVFAGMGPGYKFLNSANQSLKCL